MGRRAWGEVRGGTAVHAHRQPAGDRSPAWQPGLALADALEGCHGSVCEAQEGRDICIFTAKARRVLRKPTQSGKAIIVQLKTNNNNKYFQRMEENSYQLRILEPDELPFKGEDNIKTFLDHFSKLELKNATLKMHFRKKEFEDREKSMKFHKYR